jgi:hypothetical protein
LKPPIYIQKYTLIYSTNQQEAVAEVEKYSSASVNQSTWICPNGMVPWASRRALAKAAARPARLSFSAVAKWRAGVPALPALARPAWARLLASSAQ